MTINNKDVKIYQSQDNTDNDSGGGSRTATEIQDGLVNNLFPDISRVDTVSGDVALRKIFPAIVTENRDVYYGGHAIIRKPPVDPKVSALLFHTDDPHDIRSQAQNKIESYVVASYKEQFYLYGNHIAGARAVTFLQTTSEAPPSVGVVYLLKEGNDEQYVRISSVDAQTVTLVSNEKSYTRRRIICEIEQGLEFNFTGSVFSPEGQQLNTCDTFATQIADAAKYYGTTTLKVDAAQDDVTIEVDSIYENLVPASITQTPIVNQQALVNGSTLKDTGISRTDSRTLVSGINPSFTVDFPIMPNSITNIGSAGVIDDGKGNIIDAATSEIKGEVDYATGTITDYDSQVTGSVSVYYTVANVIPSSINYSEAIKVTQENQGLVWVRNLSPIPTESDLYIDYRANGKWYRFKMNPDLTLGKDSSIGAGQLNDNGDGTGTINVTLGALPDIDSSIIISWGSGERLTERSEIINGITTAYMEIDLGQTNCDPTSLSMVAWSRGSNQNETITCDANGNLSDTDATSNLVGYFDFINGKIAITDLASVNRFDNTASGRNVTINCNYSDAGVGDTGEVFNEVFSRNPDVGETAWDSENQSTGVVVFTIPATPLRNTVMISLDVANYRTQYGRYRRITLNADQNGDLRVFGRVFNDPTVYGNVAVNGTVTLQLNQLSRKVVSSTSHFSAVPRYTQTNEYQEIGDDISVQYRTQAPASYNQSLALNDLIENLVTYKVKTAGDIAGEMYFKFGADSTLDPENYYTREGNVFDFDDIQRGTINYLTGEIEMDYHKDPDVLFIGMISVFTDELNNAKADFVRSIAFRTSGDRLTTSSFQARYDIANVGQTATSDGNGNITGSSIDAGQSYVDTQTGMAYIVFTSDLDASTLFYDAVAESSLPLDPDLLGLNPVRLPIDGRVPIFDAGRHVVIYNEVETNVTPDPVADAVVNVGRTGQSYMEVIDANGLRLDPDQYTADLNAGTITFANPLSLVDKYGAALTAPFKVVDRVEDMLLATDVSINGLITLSAGLSRAYTNGVTRVASALVWGDVGARYYNLFAQEIWDNGNPVWSDELVGDPTTSQYDDVQYPIQVLNRDATSGRWAIIFRSATTVDVAEEKLGIVQANISISVDNVAPNNPATGQPYFIMDRQGFGAGWVTNNVIRFNTDSGDMNAWVIRTVQSGALSEQTDKIDVEIRGDAN